MSTAINSWIFGATPSQAEELAKRERLQVQRERRREEQRLKAPETMAILPWKYRIWLVLWFNW